MNDEKQTFVRRNSSLFIWLGTGLTVICLLLLGLSWLFFPIDGEANDNFARFLGRFHPLILHFPIALLILVILLELGNAYFKKTVVASALNSVIVFVLSLAALSAALTASMGLMLASTEGHWGELVSRHRTMGFILAALASIIFALRLRLFLHLNRFLLAGYRVGLACVFVLILITAHDGGSMVHGQSYLSEFAPKLLKPLLGGYIENRHREDAQLGGTFDTAVSDQTHKIVEDYAQSIAPLFDRYCSSCHGASKQNANLRFDELSPLMGFDHEVDSWESIRDTLNAHQMPPLEEGRQPNANERQEMVAWIDGALQQASIARRENRDLVARRLTISEYNASLQDLFETEANFVKRLPPAPVSEKGFSRDASLLGISSIELEYFLSIARDAVERYVDFNPETLPIQRFLVEYEENIFWDLGPKEPFHDLSLSEFEAKKALRASAPVAYLERPLFAVPEGAIPNENASRAVSMRLDSQFALLSPSHNVSLGEVVVRVSAAANIGGDQSAPRMEVHLGVNAAANIVSTRLGECDVLGSKEAPQTCEFRVPLEEVYQDFRRKRLFLYVYNVSRHEDAIYARVPHGANDPERSEAAKRVHEKVTKETLINTQKLQESGVNELFLDAAEVEIIPRLAEETLKPWQKGVMNLQVGTSDRMPQIKQVIRDFMQDAYRRSVTTQEVDRKVALYAELIASGDSMESALRNTLVAVLVSEQFLFVGAPVSVMDGVAEIASDELNQLASKLSYFLWGTPPDEPLRSLAAKNQLSDPAVLNAQVERLLDDPKSKSFTEHFAREWLRLDKFDLVAVNPEFYPQYDEALAKDMIAETIFTFQDVFHHNRDARELIHSDGAFVNQRLAKHYGLPAVSGGELREVEVDKSSGRGGLLGQGAIHTLTADGSESNPIFRGVWILERILHDPPPPPPPSVPPLEQSIEGFDQLTLKQKIELHAEQSACSACHAKIDPWGLALEGFDAIGQARDSALVIHPETGEHRYVPIDSATVINTGEEIEGAKALSNYLVEERTEQVMDSIAWHMFAYGLGRLPDIGDQEDLKLIALQFKTSGYQLPSLINAIVQSDAFLTGVSYEPQSQLLGGL